ncbi:MAG: hypothetical protein MJZ58_06330, partial [Paludibacteraceae bacterium]|nr:hypothetical protein [Paludibacteraceae bacterium]
AGMQRFIDVRQIRIQEIKDPFNSQLDGFSKLSTLNSKLSPIVIINPPYGERLAQDKDILRLYAEMGTALKHQFTGATAWIISSNEDALKCIGLKPSRRIHLMNGELECLFNKYELFAGERKVWKRS